MEASITTDIATTNVTDETPIKAKKVTKWRAVCSFMKCGTCSEGMMNVLDRGYANPLEGEEHGVAPLAGGIVTNGYQCGLLWGATLAGGAQAYRLHGAGPHAEAAAVEASQRLVESFREQHGTTDCLDISQTDWDAFMNSRWKQVVYFLKGGPFKCMRACARFAPIARDTIDAVLAEEPAERSCASASCASELVKRAGLSAEHATMVAGLAGGIGLSGGGCGALGAAVWAVGMHHAGGGMDYMAINDKGREVIERFLPASDYEFECADIVGRKFEDVDDHARYVEAGGCSALIDALVAAVKEAYDEQAEPTQAQAA